MKSSICQSGGKTHLCFRSPFLEVKIVKLSRVEDMREIGLRVKYLSRKKNENQEKVRWKLLGFWERAF